MAGKKDMDFTYTAIDRIFRLSIGETGDFSGAMYNGDFSLTLEEAQRTKHLFIAGQLGIKKGSRVLDMGCGWGPFIRFATEELGAGCTGLTLSEGQARACRKNGFNVHVLDCKKVTPEHFGMFDAVVSLGAFEHFCSVEEWKAGQQDQVYQDFFKTVFDLLPAGGRFFLQTMTFSKNLPAFGSIGLHAKRGSAEHVMALMLQMFPGSWLPYGPEMIERDAASCFKLITKSSGRLDYIETLKQWRKRFVKFNLEKYGLFASRYLTSEQFRDHVSLFRVSPTQVCFEQEILDHYRMVFEKV